MGRNEPEARAARMSAWEGWVGSEGFSWEDMVQRELVKGVCTGDGVGKITKMRVWAVRVK